MRKGGKIKLGEFQIDQKYFARYQEILKALKK